MINWVKQFIGQHPKLSIVTLILFTYIYILPPTLTAASLWYFRDWQNNAQQSAVAIAGSNPYCIVVPLPEVGFYVPDTFESVDLKSIIAKEVNYKLTHFDFSLGTNRRPRAGKDIHFGIFTENKLYYWAFMSQTFTDAALHRYNGGVYQGLKIQQIIAQSGFNAPLRQASVALEAPLPTTYQALGHNGLSDQEQQIQRVEQVADKQQWLDQWQRKIAQLYPQLTPDDFICPYI